MSNNFIRLVTRKQLSSHQGQHDCIYPISARRSSIVALSGRRPLARQAQALAERDQADLERERKDGREALEKAADAAGSIKVLREMLDKATAEIAVLKAERVE